MYFSASIFALAKFRSPTGTALLIACTNFVFTLGAFSAIDRIGRRRILLFSIPFMSIGLLLSSVAFTFVTISPSTTTTAPTTAPPWAPTLLIASLLLFVAAYALGLGNVPWQQSELFPLRVRAVGSAIATTANWLCNALVGMTFLPMVERLTAAGAVGVYAVVCVGVWVWVWARYPERMGVGLEDVGGEEREEG